MSEKRKNSDNCNEIIKQQKKDLPENSNCNYKESSKVELSAEQKARIELNRQRALLIRQEKLNKQRVYNQKEEEPKKVIRIDNTKLIDTGSGFFIEEDDQKSENKSNLQQEIIKDPAPFLHDEQPFCEECDQPFTKSYLLEKFDCLVCDKCRDADNKHCLITRTDAKNNYLLKDSDIDRREPKLKFILKKNPHNSRWGDMKLYLKLQVEKRALEIWETEEALEEAIVIINYA